MDFPEFSRHLIMSILNWEVVNEKHKIHSKKMVWQSAK